MYKGGEGIKGRRAASISLCQCGASRQRLSKPMPPPRQVIESHTLPILLMQLSLRWRRRRARVGTKVNITWGQNLHVALSQALCVTDELLVHHWEAAFPNMMRSQFPIGTCHTPTCQKPRQSHKRRQ